MADRLGKFDAQFSYPFCRFLGHCAEVGDCKTDPQRLSIVSEIVFCGLRPAGGAVILVPITSTLVIN